MAPITYNAVVEQRTRFAAHLLENLDLLALYEGEGGLRSDLESIRDHGIRAQTLSATRSQAQGNKIGSARSTHEEYDNLRDEHTSVMNILRVVEHDLERAAASPQILARVEKILVDESAVVFRPAEDTAADLLTQPSGKKKALRSRSHEAMRAEIERDITALLELTEAHPLLAQRKVSLDRLKALQQAARDLSGKLGQTAAAVGVSKEATQSIHDAVAAQSALWSACRRLFRALADKNEKVQSLLKQAK